MGSIVICEKSTQAGNLKKALGTRFGPILPAQGHLISVLEPDDVNPEKWGGPVWHPGLMYEGKFYPKDVAKDVKAKPQLAQKLATIGKGIRNADTVIIATDCDREGEVIGRELCDHFGFRGTIMRAIFNAEDAVNLQDAFKNLEPAANYEGRYQAGLAREQLDQIANLSYTRTASWALKPENVQRMLVGLGRVKTPTAFIVAMRELEIRNFKPEDLQTIIADAKASGGFLQLECSKYPATLLKQGIGSVTSGEEEDQSEIDEALQDQENVSDRIKRKDIAQGLAAAVKGQHLPISMTQSNKKSGPPLLFDLTSLSSETSKRFGWSGDKTLNVCQSLYSTHFMVTYPRGEARYLPDQNEGDVSTLVPALTALPDYQRFAPLVANPVIRRGKSGTFNGALLKKQNLSHYAIIPNVTECHTFAAKLPNLTADERKLFDLITRQYLAAFAPDYTYKSTQITAPFEWKGHTWQFGASGSMPIDQGWREIIGSQLKAGAELPSVQKGEKVLVERTSLRTSQTKPPARYDQGALLTAMQEVWRFSPKGSKVRARLQEAKGIGTPATRGDVLKGLIGQGQLIEKTINKKKVLVPSDELMELYAILQDIAPNLSSPARTAQWEMIYDAVERGEMTAKQAVETALKDVQKEIEAIAALKGKKTIRMGGNRPFTSTSAMVSLAEKIAERKGIKPPRGYKTNGQACKAFLDEHAGPKKEAGAAGSTEPSEKQLAFARKISEENNAAIPAAALENRAVLSAWIDNVKANAPKGSSSRPDREPTENQLKFARMLAERNNIELTEGVITSMKACSEFITEYKDKGQASGRKKYAKKKRSHA